MQETDHSTKRPRVRKRTRGLRQRILQQVEFLFSDANLRRDKYLWKLISESHEGGVRIADLLKFNQISILSSDAASVAKILRVSATLKVSDDDKFVCRRNMTIEDKPNAQSCCIFIDKLPAMTTVQWLENLFKPYGKIDYITLPRYRSGAIKGFGFVEFSTPAEAVAASKPNMYNRHSTEIGQNVLVKQLRSSRKRELHSFAGHEDEAPSAKRSKMDNTTIVPQKKAITDSPRKSRNRVRRRGRQKKTHRLEALSKLQILPFYEWQKLKSEYKQEQKRNFSQAKIRLRQIGSDASAVEVASGSSPRNILRRKRKQDLLAERASKIVGNNVR